MKRNRYHESFKSETVKLTLSSEVSYAEIARDLGVNDKTLCNWISQTMTAPKSPVTQAKNLTRQDYQTLERKNRAFTTMQPVSICFFHTLEVAWIHQQTFTNKVEACTAIFWFIEAYDNRKRRHSTPGYLKVQ